MPSSLSRNETGFAPNVCQAKLHVELLHCALRRPAEQGGNATPSRQTRAYSTRRVGYPPPGRRTGCHRLATTPSKTTDDPSNHTAPTAHRRAATAVSLRLTLPRCAGLAGRVCATSPLWPAAPWSGPAASQPAIQLIRDKWRTDTAAADAVSHPTGPPFWMAEHGCSHFDLDLLPPTHTTHTSHSHVHQFAVVCCAHASGLCRGR